MKEEATFDEFVEAIANQAKVPAWQIERGVDSLVDWYREKLISNYMEGAGFGDLETMCGSKVGEIGEGGFVVLTSSRKQAVKAVKKYDRDVCGDNGIEVKEKDFREGMCWTYKRPEEEGGDFEYYYDFNSQHPKAKKCYYIYF
jgi:hypothetical protein